MTLAKPQTIGSELLDRIELLVNSLETPTQLTLRRLTADADRLQKVDAAEASTVKAAIAALEWDAEEIVRWTNNSIRLRGTDGVYANAAINYRLANMMNEAIAHAKTAVEIGPQNATTVWAAANILKAAGMWSELSRIATVYRGNSTEVQDLKHQSSVMLDALQKIGVEEEHLQLEVLAALDVARENRVRIKEIQQGIIEDPEIGLQLVVSIFFGGTLDDEIHWEGVLANRLAQLPHWNPLKLSVEFSYLS